MNSWSISKRPSKRRRALLKRWSSSSFWRSILSNVRRISATSPLKLLFPYFCSRNWLTIPKMKWVLASWQDTTCWLKNLLWSFVPFCGECISNQHGPSWSRRTCCVRSVWSVPRLPQREYNTISHKTRHGKCPTRPVKQNQRTGILIWSHPWSWGSWPTSLVSSSLVIQKIINNIQIIKIYKNWEFIK